MFSKYLHGARELIKWTILVFLLLEMPQQLSRCIVVVLTYTATPT
jgi:hypothetical protein